MGVSHFIIHSIFHELEQRTSEDCTLSLSYTNQNIDTRQRRRSYCDAVNACIFKYILFSLLQFMGRKPAGVMYILYVMQIPGGIPTKTQHLQYPQKNASSTTECKK